MVWIVFAPLAFSLTIIQYVLFPQSPLFYFAQSPLFDFAVSFAITSGMATALFYAGAFGGADAKALMCLALALPNPINPPLIQGVKLFLPIFPFTVFSNAVLLAALTAVYALIRNVFWRLRKRAKLFAGLEDASLGRKIVALLTGYKVEPATLEKSPHIYPLEDIATGQDGQNKRVLLTFPKDETRETIVARILTARKEGKIQNGVWVTPGLPLLIFITAGLVITLFVGDLIWILLRLVLIPR